MLTSATDSVSKISPLFFCRALSQLQLPVIEELRRNLLPDVLPNLLRKNVLKDTILVCGQHLLSNIVPMFEEFQQEGAGKIFVVGKSYSNNKDAISQLNTMNNVVVERSSEQLALGGFSTSYTADVNAMWRRCTEYIASLSQEEKQKCKIIVLDDGGVVLANMPREIQEMPIPIVGIEQTSSGVPMAETIPCPTIEVATSAVKAWFEPEWVAEKIVLEIEKRKPKIHKKFPEYDSILNGNPIIGIVGLGNIGMEILKQFTKQGYKRFVIHDLDNEKMKQAMSFAKQHHDLCIETVGATPLVISGADIIIGCTGKPVLTPELDELKVIRMPKIFVSASSRDIEFLPLLRHIQIHNRNGKDLAPLEDRNYRNGFGANILLINGGTPVNFTRESESVPTDRIQLIRGLKVAAVWQARRMMDQGLKDLTCAGNYMLLPEGQVKAVRAFAKVKPELVESVLKRKSLFDGNDDMLREAIIRDSGGDMMEKICPRLVIR